mgnify:CR=1 FL=1
MKTISKLFVIVCFVMVGCTTQTIEPVTVVTDNVTKNVSTWTDDQRNYWVTLYFTRMSHDPAVRMKYPPEHLYNMCKCIIDVMSIDYDYETFMKDFNKQPIAPMNAQIVYDVSFKCSMEEVQLMRLKAQEPNPKDAI